jgi:hypothetical protein
MTEIRHAMLDYVGEVLAGAAPRSEEFRRRLREIQAHNTRYFAIPVVMLAAAFVVATALVVRSASATAVTAVVSSGFGISVISMIRLMLSFWRKKVATELMIELSELDDEVLRKVVAQLLTWMK